MFYGKKKDLNKYRGRSKYLDQAIEYLRETDLCGLPLGRNEVDHEQIYINKMQYDTMAEEEGIFEAHNQYLDIHMVLAGREFVCVSTREKMIEIGRDQEDDAIFYRGVAKERYLLDTDHIFIAAPEDVHKAKVQGNESYKVTKIVCKVKIDREED